MATLSKDSSIPTSNGILHPKHINRFQVRFVSLDPNAEAPEWGDVLTRQTVRVLPFSAKSDYLEIDFEDDLGNQVSKALDTASKVQNFGIKLEVMDTREIVLETYLFTHVELAEVITLGFDYAGSSGSRTTVNLKSSAPEFDVRIQQLPEEVQAFYHAFRAMKATLSVDDGSSNGAVAKRGVFSFGNLVKTYGDE